MISFDNLKNYIINDPLSDWFTKINDKYNAYESTEPTKFEIMLREKKQGYKCNFINFLMNTNHYKTINLDYKGVKDRIDSKQKCIFIRPNLYHKKYNLSVIPDFIIHRDIFNEIFNEVHMQDSHDKSLPQSLPLYIVSNIVYQTVNFNSDMTDLINENNLYYYKCKIYLCNEILGYNDYGILFAKEYRFKDTILKKKSVVGRYNFHNDMRDKILHALGWLDNLNRYYDEWLIYPKPTITELYPNMNIKTGPWVKEKCRLAEEIQEITLVWNISYHKRCLLHDKGIYKWSDPLLLNNIYPYEIRETERKRIQEKMIHMNKQNELKISPRRIKNLDFINHVKDKTNSIVLDFESVINLEERSSYFNDKMRIEIPKICIIGCINLKNNVFKDFTIRYLDLNEEEKIVRYWLQYLKRVIGSTIKIYHWSSAERVYIDYMREKYPHLDYPNFTFVDLLSYFKMEPITIQGCFGYGLKEIVKMLYNHELIKNKWVDDTDGLEAMIEIINKSQDALHKRIPIKRYTEIKKIIYYNYMDCKVIVDILEMLENMI
tara:strand:+ start:8282 stop:9919 length:1638 start_codon:yes stop_codon:yes gene_type:complete